MVTEAETGNTYNENANYENANFDDSSNGDSNNSEENSQFIVKLIEAGVPADLVVNVLSMISEITARTGYLDTAAIEDFLNYFKTCHYEEDSVKRTQICIEAMIDFFAEVYPNPDAIPTYSNDIPPLDIDSLGMPETNVIMKFHRYGSNITDTYSEYLVQSGFSMVGTIAQRRIYAHLNGRQIYPNLWTGIVGLSGYARKTAAMDLAKDRVLNSCGKLYLGEDVNPPSFLEAMATEIKENKKDPKTGTVSAVPHVLAKCDETRDIKRSQRCLFKDEFGQLLAQGTKSTYAGFFETLLRMHSCKSFLKNNVGKTTLVEDPYLSMIWATTDETMKKYFTREDITSGFLARTLLTDPTYVKPRKPVTEGDSEKPENVKMEKEIETDMAIIDSILKSSSDMQTNKAVRAYFQAGVLEMLESWVAERELYYAQRHDELMSAFTARFQENAVKLAIIIELGNIPELVKKKGEKYRISEFRVSKAAMESALKIIDIMYLPYAIKLALELKADISSTSQSGVSKDISRVEGQLSKTLKMDMRTCMRNCSLKKANFEECVESLLFIGAVKQAKVVTKENKLQKWLVYVPLESRNVIFSNEYSNVVVSPYVTGIELKEMFSFDSYRKDKDNGNDDGSNPSPNPKADQSPETDQGLEEFIEEPKSAEEQIDSIIHDGTEIISPDGEGNVWDDDENDIVSSENPDW